MDFGDLEALQASYRSEANDLLADLGDALLLLEQDGKNMDVINRVFRAMHTLKGSGASAGFVRLANFVHHVEDVFNRIRNRQLETTPELIDATLQACDCCTEILKLGATDTSTPVALEAKVLNALRPFLPDMDKAKSGGAKAAPRVRSRYTIGFRPNREIFFSGTDPASLLLELSDLGKLELKCETGDLLGCDDFDPEQCYLSWQATLESDHPEQAIRNIFQFIEEECDISIQREELAAPSGAKADRFRVAAQQCFIALHYAIEQCQAGDENRGLSGAQRSAQTLLSISTAQHRPGAAAAAKVILDAISAVQNGAILDGGWLLQFKGFVDAAIKAVESGGTLLEAVAPLEKAIEPVAAAETVTAAAGQSLRVESSKLDALMRLAGELLVARGALPSFAERIERGDEDATLTKEMRDAGAKISRLADDLQATVMSIRMVPVRTVFQRFPRLVRDIARNLSKNIELHVSGEETELDKNVIESIGDPLTHIIRNAADHGIESKEDRLAKGKPAVGRIELSAYTRGSNVTIQIKDDGKGLDAEKLRRRAVEKGLFSQAAASAMDEQAAFKIILAAGFSTVDTVTDLSGRGVGMDVVRNSVEALHGAIHIDSKVGGGTCFRIELPASLLVSKGILVAVADQQVVLPMDSIRNMVKLPRSLLRDAGGQKIIPVRGSVFPVLSLAHALAFTPAEDTARKGGSPEFEPESERGSEDSEDLLAIGIVEATAGSYGLIVDRFVGEVEVVVKPLTGVLAHMPEYVGATIMGDGRTVLVVNTERLFALHAADAGARKRPFFVSASQ